MSARRQTFRNRLMSAFALFTLVTTGLFGGYAVIFMYATEDAFFNNLLRQEAVLQQEQRQRHGAWAAPRQPFMRIYESGETLPDGLGALLAAEPQLREASGREGRHYHLLRLDANTWLVAEVSRQLVVRPIRDRVLGWLAWSALLLVALALLAGLLLARRVTAPLSSLVARIDGSNAQQLPHDLAHGFANDEIGTLAQALQALAQRIRDAIVREREFTRDASHELRTPLAVIRGAAERIDSEPSLSPQGRSHLVHLQQSVLQLQQTMDTLLALARAESAPAAAAARVAILPALERVVVEQAVLLEGKQVAVHIEVGDSATTTIPAPVAHILLSNLVGNAFAHTQAGSITIDTDGARLRIVNRGTTAPAAIDCFEPYAKREGSAGFGLGLDIVRRLSERCGLDLRITFDADETSASFRLDSTAAACPAAAG